MKKLGILLGIICVSLSTLLVSSSLIANNAALVINSGRDGLTCTLSGFYNGSGDATVVVTSSGVVAFTCNGEVIEDGPDRATRFGASGPLGTSCDVVVTPSSRFNAECH